ncbi:hypothetical protein BC937DRAFT_93018 [Endogone sp. FLAS-F59071]|nr:hypothetical protein BC937DRAFT_93018 [Endogone sp. FLAS-F59071]|eukprot:RUS21326.1 hypothetical protein BC937DRAFT_93018 [Endogone sp. FLAS-F59071]
MGNHRCDRQATHMDAGDDHRRFKRCGHPSTSFGCKSQLTSTYYSSITLPTSHILWHRKYALYCLYIYTYGQNRNAQPIRRFKNPVERLIGYFFIPLLLGTFARSFANGPFPDDIVTNMTYCEVQTAFVEFQCMSEAVLQFMFSWHLINIIRVFRGLHPWSIDKLTANLIKSERVWITAAFSIGLIFAFASVIYAGLFVYSNFIKFESIGQETFIYTIPMKGPRNYWCWVLDTSPAANGSLNTLMFFYLWEWIAILAGIVALSVGLYDYISHPGDYKGEKDFRISCIISFFWFLLVDMTTWVISSASRFWSYSYPGCFNIALGMGQAILTNGRGVLFVFLYFVLLFNNQFPVEADEPIILGSLSDKQES